MSISSLIVHQVLTYTVTYQASILKSLFSTRSLEMAEPGNLDLYAEDRKSGGPVGVKWINRMMRSWNTVLAAGGIKLSETVRRFAVEVLTSMDKNYTTHFGEQSLFMTCAKSWTDFLPLYVEGVLRIATAAAQQTELVPEVKKFIDELEPKCRFFMLDAANTTLLPVMPLLTSSALKDTIRSLKEIYLALDEVRVYHLDMRLGPVEPARASQLE
jgi:hypothetical protein